MYGLHLHNKVTLRKLTTKCTEIFLRKLKHNLLVKELNIPP